jgi:N-acetylmuramoyl-L-alanine amidase
MAAVLAGLMAVSLVVACGCTEPAVITGQVPRTPHENFTHKPIEIPVVAQAARPESKPVAPPVAPVLPPPTLPPAPPRLVLPLHEAAWEVTVQERPWRWIVVHHSASDNGSAAAFDAFHRNTRHWDELGYHFVIGNGTGSADGLVEVGSRWPKQKWGAHCRVGDIEEYNNFGIGICLVGDFEKHRPTVAQMASLTKLVDYLATKYHIDDSHIIGHGTVDDTKCPGKYCPISNVIASVRRARSLRGV